MNEQRIIKRLENQINDASRILNTFYRGPRNPEFQVWKRNTEILIEKLYSYKSRNYKDFVNLKCFDDEVSSSCSSEDFRSDIMVAIGILKSIINDIQDFGIGELKEKETNSYIPIIEKNSKKNIIMERTNKIFIIHGHDSGTKETVARFLKQIDLEPIILHEQANEGKTIIEKFEKHADVGFAIALLTPDDEGFITGKQNEKKFRARQNVIYELGYFAGKLGRHRVMALKKGEIEIPSDILGVLYENIDEGGAWKMRLVKELKTAGFDVDANKAL